MGLRNIGLSLAFLLAGAMACSATDVAILRNGYSIRHERREVLGLQTRLYMSGDPANFVDVATVEIDRIEKDDTPVPSPSSASPLASAPTSIARAPASRNLGDVINSASDLHQLDPDLINSVIRAESGFNPRAVSPKGAMGLMQLMPNTASQLGVPNAFDPEANVEGGTRYLRELLERYNFDLIKALAAYNAGPMRVEQYKGVPPYHETRAYVARIIRDFNRKKLAQQHKKEPATNPSEASPKRQVSRSNVGGLAGPARGPSNQATE